MLALKGTNFDQFHSKVIYQLWMVLNKKYLSSSTQCTLQGASIQSKQTRAIKLRRHHHHRPLHTFHQPYRLLHTTNRLNCSESNNGDGIGNDKVTDSHQIKNNENEVENSDQEKGETSSDIETKEIGSVDSKNVILNSGIDDSNDNVIEPKSRLSRKGSKAKKEKEPIVENTDKEDQPLENEKAPEISPKVLLEAKDYLIDEDIKETLASLGIPYTEGYTGLQIVCPKFGKLAMKKKRKEESIYINTTSGTFSCHNCQASGPWRFLKDNLTCQKSKKPSKFRDCFKDICGVTTTEEETPPRVIDRLNNAQTFSSLTNEQFDYITTLFDWQGIRKDTFDKYGVRYKAVGHKHEVLFPIQSMRSDCITWIRIYSCYVTEEEEVKISSHLYPRSKEPQDMFGWQHRPTEKTLVITSNEVNAMAISQSAGVTALSLNTISQLPMETLPALEGFTKIVLWIGTNISAWEYTNVFAKKLNEKRCFIFRLNTMLKMPLQLLQEDEQLAMYIMEARTISHKDIVRFTHLRGDVFTELAHLGQVAGVQWQRHTVLNKVLKGHRRGELTVLTGPTGSGKTTFVSDYSLDLCMQGVNTLWGSFEINNVKLAKMMLRQYSGKDLSKNLDDFEEIADNFAALPMYFMTYFGQENVNKVLEVMTHAVYVHDISHVVLDNLQFMMGMDYTEFNRFIKQDHIVAAFRQFATEKNCHVTLITHPKKMDDSDLLSTASIFGSAKLTQEADNVLLLQDLKIAKSVGRAKFLQISKNRFDGELDVLSMTFNKDSLSFTLKEMKKARRKDEKEEDASSDNKSIPESHAGHTKPTDTTGPKLTDLNTTDHKVTDSNTTDDKATNSNTTDDKASNSNTTDDKASNSNTTDHRATDQNAKDLEKATSSNETEPRTIESKKLDSNSNKNNGIDS